MRRPLLTRREVLLASGALLAGCRVEEPRSGVLGGLDRLTERAQGLLFRPGALAPTEDEDQLTPAGAFPQYRIGADFPEAPPGYALEIGGMVRTPLRLTPEDLQRLDRVEMRVRHHCVEGWSAVASWHGVRVSTLATLAGADPSAGYVAFVSFEPTPDGMPPADAKAGPTSASPVATTYTSSWDLASALHPQTLVAYGMNGAPLPREHGGPARLYSAVKLGYKMVKWLAAIRFLPEPTGGYWEDQGYEWFAGV